VSYFAVVIFHNFIWKYIFVTVIFTISELKNVLQLPVTSKDQFFCRSFWKHNPFVSQLFSWCCWRMLQHLVGHYGGAWQLQKFEFPRFPGPIVVTANCIIEPMKSYKNRLFTSNETGWPGCQHVRLPADADKVVAAALGEPGFSEDDCQPGKAPGSERPLSVGFGRDVILSNADKVSIADSWPAAITGRTLICLCHIAGTVTHLNLYQSD